MPVVDAARDEAIGEVHHGQLCRWCPRGGVFSRGNMGPKRLLGVHRVLVENVLWGLDVVPFAIHLAGSALALHEPDVGFGEMNLSTLPIGGSENRLGSLELFTGQTLTVQADLVGSAAMPATVKGRGEARDKVTVPELDFVRYESAIHQKRGR